MPLAIRLRKPLCSRRRWLVNARILVNKSADRSSIGQTMMNQYFAHIPSIQTVRNASLEGSNLFKDTFRQTYWVYGVPVCRDQDENSQVIRFDIVLVYSISADAGDETIILAKRCSVMPLKCICCEFWIAWQVWVGSSRTPSLSLLNFGIACSYRQ
jgi:hypothetical protein